MLNSDPVIYVVDGDSEVRSALKILARSVGLAVKEFTSGPEFLLGYEPSNIGCLILEVRLPRMSGFELQQKLREFDIDLPVIFNTSHGDIQTVVRTIKAGAFDFVEKPCHEDILLGTIQQAIVRHREIRSSNRASEVMRHRLEQLTPRERQIFAEVVVGKTGPSIARKLGISVKTVEFHRANIMTKLHAKSLADLVRVALFIENQGHVIARDTQNRIQIFDAAPGRYQFSLDRGR